MNSLLFKTNRFVSKSAFLVCIFLFGMVGLSFGQTEPDLIPPKPEPAVFVNDFASVMQPEAKANLERKLEAVSQATTNQIVVVVVASLGDYEISDFGVQLALKWGIGQKGKDNGALLLIGLKEKKIRIETGYGLEADLPDIICKQIIDQLIKPNFKAGDYSAGILLGTDAILQRVVPKEQWSALGIGSQGFLPDQQPQKKNKKNSGGGWGIWIILGIVLLLSCFKGGRSILGALFLSALFSGGRGGGGGGFGGGGGGGSSFGGGSFGGGGASGDW